MRILVSIPVSRNIPMCLQSIHSIAWDSEIRFSFERGGDVPCGTHITSPGRSENCLRKALIDRRMMLNNEFDAMLHIDDDMLIPPDALLKLDALNAPVAYGLYVWRNEPHRWNIVSSIAAERPVFYDDDGMRETWGKIVTVAGVGTGCVLIRREVLEQVSFSLRGTFGYDYYFALDCFKRGILQVCDTSVICGHVDIEHECIYTPTSSGFQSIPIG